jgi:Leucine-rich repeat (LRR) protein
MPELRALAMKEQTIYEPLDIAPLSQLTQLRYLVLTNCGIRVPEHLTSFQQLRHLELISVRLSTIQALAFPESLEYLRLKWVFFSHLSTQQSIDLTCLKRLRHLEFKNLHLGTYPIFPESLEYLQLSNWRHAPRIPLVQPKLHSLKTFIFEPVNSQDANLVVGLLSTSEAPLTTLSMCGTFSLKPTEWAQLMSSGEWTGLEELLLDNADGIDDDFAPLILENMPNLKMLNLSDTAITKSTLNTLAKTKNKIKKLWVAGCFFFPKSHELCDSINICYGRPQADETTDSDYLAYDIFENNTLPTG